MLGNVKIKFVDYVTTAMFNWDNMVVIQFAMKCKSDVDIKAHRDSVESKGLQFSAYWTFDEWEDGGYPAEEGYCYHYVWSSFLKELVSEDSLKIKGISRERFLENQNNEYIVDVVRGRRLALLDLFEKFSKTKDFGTVVPKGCEVIAMIRMSKIKYGGLFEDGPEEDFKPDPIDPFGDNKDDDEFGNADGFK